MPDDPRFRAQIGEFIRVRDIVRKETECRLCRRRRSFASVANDLGFTEVTIAALVGHAKGSVPSKYIYTLDTALIMTVDTIAGYVQGPLDGGGFRQTAETLDRYSRKAALTRLLKRASSGDLEEDELERRLAA